MREFGRLRKIVEMMRAEADEDCWPSTQPLSKFRVFDFNFGGSASDGTTWGDGLGDRLEGEINVGTVGDEDPKAFGRCFQKAKLVPGDDLDAGSSVFGEVCRDTLISRIGKESVPGNEVEENVEWDQMEWDRKWQTGLYAWLLLAIDISLDPVLCALTWDTSTAWQA